MRRKYGYILCFLFVMLLSACGSTHGSLPSAPSRPIAADSMHEPPEFITPTPTLNIPHQRTTPTPTPAPTKNNNPSTGSPPTQKCLTFSNDATLAPAKNGSLAAPYGQPPQSAQATQIAQQLFQVINSDRAACGLPPFSWNATLAQGALLHSWNMYHCGFSHTCPDGMSQCQRIANEGYAGASDCGENIGLAGPSSPLWNAVYSVQESMAHEAPDGWHRIHLFSTTLHSIGIGVYIDSSGQAWFTEDMVS